MRWMHTVTILVLFIVAVPVVAHAETTAPSTQQAIDPKSPRGALKAYSDQLPAGGTKAASAAYHATNEKERKLAKALARADLAGAALEKLTREKFGQKASDAIVHAMRSPTDMDLVDATEKIDGDKARVEWADGRDSLEMVKVNGKWKISVADLLDADDKDDEAAKTNIEIAEALETITKKFESGEYPNTTLLERAVKQRMFRILGADEADD